MTISFTGGFLSFPASRQAVSSPAFAPPPPPSFGVDTVFSPSPESGNIPELVVLSVRKFRKSNEATPMAPQDAPMEVTLTGIEENHIDGLPEELNHDEKKEKRSRGGWAPATLLLANQALATFAFFGVGVNLVLFLTRVITQSNAAAANTISKWTGTVYLCSLIGAFLSDSYWGRFITCAVFQLILVVGLVLLSLSSQLFLVKPHGCGTEDGRCHPPTLLGTAMFYVSLYLVALGYGGHQPTLATFGADQFDESKPKERNSKAMFFCLFYAALNVGSLFSNTILVYYEDIEGLWVMGFWVSTGCAAIALLSFIFGYSGYRYIKPSGNPLPRIAQVFVAAFRKRKVGMVNANELYEVEGTESAIKGSRKIVHSNDYSCLDKAAVVTESGGRCPEQNPWRLCTVTQVEEAKCVLRMLPIWLCTIVYSIIFTQMASLFVEQGAVMNSYIGSFHLPAASMSTFDIFSVLTCTLIYRQVLVPIAGRLSGNPKGLSELQRMGIGLIIGLFAMVAAGLTEVFRLQLGREMSIFWQVPQYVLVGASEVFMYVGQLEFFNEQAPDGIKSFGSSLCMASISLGNYASSILVHCVMALTAKDDKPGWIPDNLDEGHMDNFYFLIAALAVVDFIIFVFCAKRYKPINLAKTESKEGEEEGFHDIVEV